MNIYSAIKEGSEILKGKNIKSSILDSELLMSEVLNKQRKYLILNPDKEICNRFYNNYMELIKIRSHRKPIAYLIGKKEFWKYNFKIIEDVLIPRPETEIIIEQVLELTKNKSKLRVLDVGVGSGCLILSILKEKKDFIGVGIDKSSKCIVNSKINASFLEIKDRVKFYKSDIDNFNLGKYDLIISNPPYINKLSFNGLDKEILGYEPKLALEGGLDGLSTIKKVVNKSSKLLKINGKLILEIAFDQKNKVKNILRKKGFYINKVLKDLANNDRCIVSTKIWIKNYGDI